MGRADFLQLGDWNVQCYQCGFKGKASQMVKNWQGYYVHPEHNEPRQPQDFVRAIPDLQTPPWTQPWPGVTYTYTKAVIGYGNSVNKQFQAGSGLYPVTITTVFVSGSSVSYSATSNGLITLSSAPADNAPVSFTGSETVT